MLERDRDALRKGARNMKVIILHGFLRIVHKYLNQ